MRIGDTLKYIGAQHPWAAGCQVEIKGVIRDYRTIKAGEVLAGDQVIFSLTDADGFRCSAPDARVGDFEEPVLTTNGRVEGPVATDSLTLV